uniref:Cobalamin biosynthesis protein n=1 Tax=Ascaris lumbricoides TaxID=6252 RepID=A0A0M3HWS7_ASCLU
MFKSSRINFFGEKEGIEFVFIYLSASPAGQIKVATTIPNMAKRGGELSRVHLFWALRGFWGIIIALVGVLIALRIQFGRL